VIEESAMRGQLVPQERQALDNAQARFGITHEAALFSDANGGQAKASGRDTRGCACVRDANITAILGQPGWRICLLPEEEKAAMLKIVQELFILR
jgi:hypothetical protein